MIVGNTLGKKALAKEVCRHGYDGDVLIWTKKISFPKNKQTKKMILPSYFQKQFGI